MCHQYNFLGTAVGYEEFQDEDDVQGAMLVEDWALLRSRSDRIGMNAFPPMTEFSRYFIGIGQIKIGTKCVIDGVTSGVRGEWFWTKLWGTRTSMICKRRRGSWLKNAIAHSVGKEIQSDSKADRQEGFMYLGVSEYFMTICRFRSQPSRHCKPLSKGSRA